MALTKERRSQIEKTAMRKSLQFLKSLKVEVKTQKDISRINTLAKKSVDLAEYTERIARGAKVQKLLNGIAKDIRDGKQQADKLDGARMRELAGEAYTNAQATSAYQTILRSAYNAGRYEQQKRDNKRGYLIYRTRNDGRVRHSHELLNNVMLPKSDKFWKNHYPPNGFGCRCRVDSLTEAEYNELHGTSAVQEKAPKEKTITYKDKITGETLKTPETIDPGFGREPQFDEEYLAYHLDRTFERMKKTK